MNVATHTRPQAGFSHRANIGQFRHERASAAAPRSVRASVATGTYAWGACAEVDRHRMHRTLSVYGRFASATPCCYLVITTHWT